MDSSRYVYIGVAFDVEISILVKHFRIIRVAIDF